MNLHLIGQSEYPPHGPLYDTSETDDDLCPGLGHDSGKVKGTALINCVCEGLVFAHRRAIDYFGQGIRDSCNRVARFEQLQR